MIYTKEQIENVLKANSRVETEIRQDGNTPDDFSFDEWVSMIAEDLKEKCVLCRKKIEGFGCNPCPLAEKGKCCNNCDNTKVIPERIRLIQKKR